MPVTLLLACCIKTVDDWAPFCEPLVKHLLDQCAETLVFLLQMYYLNPVTWTLYGLVASNVGDVTGTLVLNDGTQTTVQQFLLDRFDYRHSFLGWVVLILVGWIVVFWAMGAYAFKRFNFQKR